MTIEIEYYTHEKNKFYNVIAFDFDGENGELHVQGELGKVVKYRLVKEVKCIE